MRSVPRVIWGVAVLALGSFGCSGGGATGPQPGVATIGFAPRPIVIPYLNVTRAQARLDRLQLVGNVPPPSGSQPPSGTGHPPPDGGDRPPEATVALDALSTTASTASIENLPQGLYSRMRFMVGRVWLEGRARGTPFRVSVAPFGAIVDIRTSMPQELGLDQDVDFEVSVDPNVWFPPYLFDGAMVDSRGEIVVDDVSNPQIGPAIVQSMLWSFSLP